MPEHRIRAPETASGNHPHRERLESFALGRLQEPDFVEVAGHLETCDSCRVAVETVPGDHLVHLVRETLGKGATLPPLRLHPGYELIEQIGRGGMGVVYRARQLGLGRIVALKLLPQGDPRDSAELARFLTEAGAMSRLTHPNFVQVYEVGEQDGHPYIACELITGGGLDRQLSGKPLPYRSACRLVSTLAKAVQFAHDRSVVHRDLKPSNILLSFGPELTARPDEESFWESIVPKIADFGLAKHLDRAQGLTRTGEIIGTPEYMAPELASGQSGDSRSETDVYSLGVILYELLTGRRPFQGTTVTETLDLVRTADPVTPRRWLPRLPRSIDVVCLKCLEKDPRRRYSSAGQLADDLDRVLDGRPILAHPPTPAERVAKWLLRNPLRAALILVGVLSAASLSGGAAWHFRRLQREVGRATAAESSALGKVREGYNSLDQLIQEIVRDHPETPGWTELDARVKEKALDYYYHVLDGADDADPRVRLTRGMLMVYAGSIHLTLQRIDRSLSDLEAARRLLEPLLDVPELAGEAGEYLSNCEYNLGQAEAKCGNPADAEVLLRQSIARLELLIRRGDSVARPEHRLALRYERLSELESVIGSDAAPRESLQTAIELRQRVAGHAPEDIPNRLQLIEDLLRAAIIPHPDRRLDEAERLLSSADATLRMPPNIEATLSGQKSQARILSLRAVLAIQSGKVDEALAEHDRGIEAARRALSLEPNDRGAQAQLFILYRAKAYTLCRAGRAVESFPVWDEALAHVDLQGRNFLRAEIALERALAGDHLLATAAAAEIGGASDRSNDTLLMLARVYSRAIEAAEREQNVSNGTIAHYATEGTNALRAIVSWLFSSPAHLAGLESDPALARLRETSSFKEWREQISTVP